MSHMNDCLPTFSVTFSSQKYICSDRSDNGSVFLTTALPVQRN